MARSTIKLDRKDLVGRIATASGVATPRVALGSTVVTSFLDDLIGARGGRDLVFNNAYEKLRWLLEGVGETYDPTRDSSQHRGESGGGTITNTGYRKHLRGLTRTPYCFIFEIADHPVSAEYHDVPGETYGFNRDVSGRKKLLESPNGSRVLFYRTGKASEEPRRHFIADAVVESIAEDADGTFRVTLANYRNFETPVSAEVGGVANWNRQHGIAEINFEAFSAIVELGTSEPVARGLPDVHEPDIVVTNQTSGLRVDAPFDAQDAPLDVPSGPSAIEVAVEPTLPVLTDIDEADPGEPNGGRGRSARARELDRYAEKRAIHVAKVMLTNAGWTFLRSRELDRVGYDLEFEKDGRLLHVEVKGIQGPRLVFTLTGKEWARALGDEDFVVVAVTNVIDASRLEAHLITRDRIAAAPKRLAALRVTLPAEERNSTSIGGRGRGMRRHEASSSED